MKIITLGHWEAALFLLVAPMEGYVIARIKFDTLEDSHSAHSYPFLILKSNYFSIEKVFKTAQINVSSIKQN